MDEVLEYPYRAKTFQMLGGALFFGACCVVMIYAALTNDRGLIVNGIFVFSKEGAMVFYICIAGVSALFVIGALAALISGIINPMVIRLTKTELYAPNSGFSRKSKLIQLKDVESISIQEIQKQRFMTIQFQNGKINISQSMLPNQEAFDTLYSLLSTRT